MAKLYNLARMTTATTGSGTITLGSAITGFLSFASAGVADGEVVTYAISDGSNSEIGRGTYTAAGTTLTRSVLRSTNGNAAVNLSGNAQVFITVAAEDLRIRLEADTTFYVRTDGSDSNSGTANTSGGAWLTLQHAMDVLVGRYDFNAHSVTVQVGAGTYTGGVVVSPWVGGGSLIWIGDTTTPSNVTVSTNANSADCFNVTVGATPGLLQIKGFKFVTAASQSVGVRVTVNAVVYLFNVEFGACAAGHLFCNAAGEILIWTNYTISGGAPNHYAVQFGSVIATIGNLTITVTGTPNFSSAFASAGNGATVQVGGSTFSGSATGARYSVTKNGVIDTSGGGANFFPGNAAGSSASGGQYV